MNIDPRLFGNGHQVVNGQQHATAADSVARSEIATLKKFVATRVGADIQMLSKAVADLNSGTEEAFAAVMSEIAEIKRAIAAIVGGDVTPVGETVEAANVQPGDENLPLEYFQGADEESAP